MASEVFAEAREALHKPERLDENGTSLSSGLNDLRYKATIEAAIAAGEAARRDLELADEEIKRLREYEDAVEKVERMGLDVTYWPLRQVKQESWICVGNGDQVSGRGPTFMAAVQAVPEEE